MASMVVIVLQSHLNGFVERDPDRTLDLTFREPREQEADHHKRARTMQADSS